MTKKNNANKYNTKRLRIILKGFFPSFLYIFMPKKKDRIIFNSTLNEAYDFNTKYLFEYFITHHPEFEIKYVINSKEKRKELNNKFGSQNNYFIETLSLKGIFYALGAKTWITSGFETPVGGVGLKYNRFVYLLGHGVMIKACVFMEKNNSWYKELYYKLIRYNFSHYLVTSKNLIDVKSIIYGCKKEQLVVVGEPATDKVFYPDLGAIESKYDENIFKEKNILYAPTWRKNSEQKLLSFEDMDWSNLDSFLEENNINIFFRMHPSFEENLDFYTEKSKRIKIIDTNIVEDINEVIGFFDLIITDYSSVHIGYLLLGKPVLFLPYDLDKYEAEVGFTMPYDSLSPGPKPKTYISFKTEILKLLNDSNYYLDERKRVSSFLNDYKENNSKNNAEFIINQINNAENQVLN